MITAPKWSMNTREYWSRATLNLLKFSASLTQLMNKLLKLIASVTRKFHPRGTERILRFICNPNTTKGLEDIAEFDGLKIKTNTSSFIEWQIFFKGSYEKNIADLIKRYLPKGGVFVDVGANVGVHTLTAARIASRVIAFEPIPEIANRLLENCLLNSFTNVDIKPVVVSDEEGIATLYVLEGSNKSSTVCKEVTSRPHRTVERGAVGLDSALKNQQVDFIKIDTDGNDRNVLMGAKEVIRKNRPVIIFEDSDETVSKFSRKEIDEMLSFFGYQQIQVGKLNTLCIPND